MSLSQDQVSFYHENGYLVLPDFFTAQEADALRKEMDSMLSSLTADEIGGMFTTNREVRCSDEYFLESAGKISFFWEEHAWNPEDNSLKQDVRLSVNKVGHALHDLNPVFKEFSYHQRIKDLSRSLEYIRPSMPQSMYIFKQPKIGGKGFYITQIDHHEPKNKLELDMHQDSTFLYTESKPCLGLWFALEDATLENGCLYVAPGTHNEGLQQRFIRDPKGGAKCIFEPTESKGWDLSRFIPAEAKKGTVILIHGYLAHLSYPNTSPSSRHAYTLHIVESAEGHPYPKSNWLQRPDEMPEPLLYEA